LAIQSVFVAKIRGNVKIIITLQAEINNNTKNKQNEKSFNREIIPSTIPKTSKVPRSFGSLLFLPLDKSALGIKFNNYQ